jgi:hypothetical protein
MELRIFAVSPCCRGVPKGGTVWGTKVKLAKILAMVVSVWLSGQAVSAQQPAKTLEDLMEEGYQTGDWANVVSTLDHVVYSDRWKDLPGEERAYVLVQRAIAEIRRDGQVRHGIFLEALHEKPDDPDANYLQFQEDVRNGDYEDAVARLAYFSHIPDLRDMIATDTLRFLVKELVYHQIQDSFSTLVNSLSETYNPGFSHGGGDFLKIERARLLLASGRRQEALNTVGTIVSPSSMMRIRTESDFRELWRMDGFDAIADIKRLYEARAAALPGIIEASPDRLQPVSELIYLHLAMGDTEAAFILTQRYADRIFSPRNFDYADADSFGREILRAHAILLEQRGDTTGAQRMFLRTAIGDSSSLTQGPSVNQMLEEMHRAVRLGKDPSPDAWLEGASLTGLSDRGWAWVDAYGSISELMKKGSPVPQISLAELEDDGGWREAPMAYLYLFLYLEQATTGDLMLAILEDPVWSRELIAMAQQHPVLLPDLPGSPGERMSRDFKALLKRPDIAAALSRAGRLESYPGVYRLYSAP